MGTFKCFARDDPPSLHKHSILVAMNNILVIFILVFYINRIGCACTQEILLGIPLRSLRFVNFNSDITMPIKHIWKNTTQTQNSVKYWNSQQLVNAIGSSFYANYMKATGNLCTAFCGLSLTQDL